MGNLNNLRPWSRTRWLLPGLVLAALCVAAAPAGGEAAPEFTKKPTAVADGDKIRIGFAVNLATDVAVGVEDAKGRVVRHLAAGLLGAKAPAPLKPDSLEQSLLWDRRDDLSQPMDPASGPFIVRVSLGLRPVLDRMLGYDPSHLDSVRGLACGPDGSLYVFDTYGETHFRDGTTTCKVFSRQGKYLRTILPYPATLPDEKLKGLKRVGLPDGSKVPFIYQFETRSFLKGLGDLPCQRPVVTSDGKFGFVGIQEGPRPFAQPGEAHFTVVGVDGSVAENPLRALISPLTDTGASLALSPDEKTVYAVGVRVGTHPAGPSPYFICSICDHSDATWKHTIPTGLVYRFYWDDTQPQVVNSRTQLKNPVSVATDKDGHVYVADVDDNRIVVFKSDLMPADNDGRPEVKGKAKDKTEPAGEVLGELKIDAPQRVEVNKATGEIYVLSGTRDLELIKFDGFKSGKVLARLNLFHTTGFPPTRRPTMALDEGANPPALWVCTQSWQLAGNGGIAPSPIRVADLGDKFGDPVPLVPQAMAGRPVGVAPMDISLDRRHDILYVNNYYSYDVGHDEWKKLALPDWLNSGPGSGPGGKNGAAGLDGNYYGNEGGNAARVSRFDSDMKFLPFQPLRPGGGKGGDGKIAGPMRDHDHGVTADAAGNVYVIWRKIGAGDAPNTRKLYSYDKDGLPRQDGPLVDDSLPGLFSVRVDLAGNIYVAAGLRPGKSLLVPGFEGRLPDSVNDPDAVNGVSGYPFIYGSIVKFGPKGGAIRSGIGGAPCNYGPGTPVEVKGAEWIVPGASTVASWATPRMAPGTFISCDCEHPGLDVDGFGRSFYGDTGRCRVGVLDTAGNQICTFGTYGNQDSAGPAIAFAWPQTVAVGDGWAYVGDRLNRRIVRVKLAATAEATCQTP